MFKNILVPLDGSELAEQAIPTAQSLAQSYNAVVHLVKVISRQSEVEAVRPAGAFTSAGEAEYSLDLARQMTESQVADSSDYLEHASFELGRHNVETHREVLEGDATEQILQYARTQNIDLIVMASHGQGGFKRLLLGSVADNIIRSGEVPVLVLTAG